jgi:hypothetical protein
VHQRSSCQDKYGELEKELERISTEYLILQGKYEKLSKVFKPPENLTWAWSERGMTII